MARKRRGLFVPVLLFTVALIAASCGDSKESGNGGDNNGGDVTATTAARSDVCRTLDYDKSAPDGGEFTDYAQLSSGGDNTSFDPQAVQTLDESQITTALWDGLTEFDYTDTCNPVLKPQVAEKWEANDDATEYTFTIRKGQEFSNGEAIKPSNFKIAWERGGSAELASSYGYLMDYVKDGDKLLDGSLKTLDSIVADDDAMTLKVTLSKPNADFPAIASFPLFYPISKADYQKIGNTTGWGTKGITIGNGPYKLESAAAPDSGEVVLVRNDKWKGGLTGMKRPHLDKITFKITADVESAYQAFQAGSGDDATIPSGQYAAAAATYKNTLKEATLGTYFFDFGNNDPVVGGDKNVKLREAISMAIDRDEINKKVYEGTRTISTGITPPGIPGFKADLCDFCKTDPTEAKKVFAEWQKEGGKLTAPLKISYNAGGSHQTVVETMVANLKDVLGIDAQANPIEESYFKVIAEEGACQICRSGWYADYPTYGNFMVDLFGKVSIGGNNLGRYDNPEFEKLISEAQKETDDTKRGDLYRQAEEQLLNKSVNAIPLNWYTGDAVYRDNIINYITPPLGTMAWEQVAKKS